ncbi:MAG: cytochrome P460 family protein [Rhizobiaceae bacterium]
MTVSRNGKNLLLSKVAVASAAVIIAGNISLAQDAPFGDPDSISYAETLWDVMEEARLVGDDTIKVRPFEGSEPHGTVQEVLATTATVDGHSGRLVVKRNHASDSIDAVYDDPTGNLAAITIMFKREEGYDPENQNWFWAKYLPDGSLDTNPNGMQLAGRVAKGADQGCIACHSAAGGDDLEVLTSN